MEQQLMGIDVIDREVHDRLWSLLVHLSEWSREPGRRDLLTAALGRNHPLLKLDLDGNLGEVATRVINEMERYLAETAADGSHAMCALCRELRLRQADLSSATRPAIRYLEQTYGCARRGRPRLPPGGYQGLLYPGLVAFRRDQAAAFFGREFEVEQLLERLDDAQRGRLVVITGASGCGKSSLLRAGLWASVAGAGHHPSGPDGDWVVSAMYPSDFGSPFVALAASLNADGERRIPDPVHFSHQLANDYQVFVKLLARLREKAGTWLLLIDQMEELFTTLPGEDSDAFLDFLRSALYEDGFRVVATLRWDFYQSLVDSPLGITLPDVLFPLRAPGNKAVESMITGPAGLVGAEVEPELVEHLARDSRDSDGGLPLLAAVLHELWSLPRPGGTITLADYNERIGGLERVIERLASDAELRLRQALGELAEAALEQVFAALVQVGSDGTVTRRRAARSTWQPGSPPDQVVGILSDAGNDDGLDRSPPVRLLVCSGDDVPRVEVAHEVLFSAWPAFAAWIESHREGLETRALVVRLARCWDRDGRPDAGRLQQSQIDRWRQLLGDAGLLAELERHEPVRSYLPSRMDAMRMELAARSPVDPDAMVWRIRLAENGCADELIAALTDAEIPEALRLAPLGEAYPFWREHLTVLIAHPDLLSAQRERLDALLRVFGDPRKGVGAVDGVPDIVWIDLELDLPLAQDNDGDVKGEGCRQFAIAQYPITLRQFQVFASDARRDAPMYDFRPGGNGSVGHFQQDLAWSHPISRVDFGVASRFCEWLQARLRERGTLSADDVIRLPTEQEWERAARGTREQQRGAEKPTRTGLYNVDETGSGPLSVGLFPADRSDDGVMDCVGNVHEMCLSADWTTSGRTLTEDGFVVARGGSWKQRANRLLFAEETRNRRLGFRVVKATREGRNTV